MHPLSGEVTSATSQGAVTHHDTVGPPPARPVARPINTPQSKSSRQWAPGAIPKTTPASGERALLQADNEPLLAGSGVGTRVVAENTAAPPRVQPFYWAPARAPMIGSNQISQPPAVQVNPSPARGRGRKRRAGNGHRQSVVGQRRRVDSEATLMPIPTRLPRPPTATASTIGATRRRSPPPERIHNPSAETLQQWRAQRIADVGPAKFNEEYNAGMYRTWRGYSYRH